MSGALALRAPPVHTAAVDPVATVKALRELGATSIAFSESGTLAAVTFGPAPSVAASQPHAQRTEPTPEERRRVALGSGSALRAFGNDQ